MTLILSGADEWRDALEHILGDFEAAWKAGAAPRVEDFVTRPPFHGPAVPGEQHSRLLVELVKVDLECRWRQGGAAGGGPRLEDYLARFPELAADSPRRLELIGEEYRVRQRWGDRPAHAEYAARFPAWRDQLPGCLLPIDAELVRAYTAAPRLAPGTGGPALSPTTLDCIDALRQGDLLSPGQLNELICEDLQGRFESPAGLSRFLVERGWLTAYQADEILQGRGPRLSLGPYILLEPLGHGGAGQVFKARHRRMLRTVAVKLIHQELLSEPGVVERFQREVQSISRLVHPNVILAHDAGQAGDNLFLVMEYAEGIDLARLVKRDGPLPVAQACDFIRQAALGLQHIHECGLVHRDIKPSNLLVSGGVASGESSGGATHPVVKILDLGLARFHKPAATADGTGTITEPGTALMGTLDFMAPEQALDFHAADVAADIYGLGCTFYFLLAGQPPFPGGTVAYKLLQHQHAAPPPLEQFRADLPAGLAALVAKMMAKDPAHRYATAGEVAHLLAAAQQGVPLAVELPPAAIPLSATVPTAGVALPIAELIPSPGPRRPRFRWLLPLALLGALGLGATGWLIFTAGRGSPPTSASVKASPPRPTGEEKPVFLSDLRETSFRVADRWELGKNGRCKDLPYDPNLKINGVPAPKGLLVHPPYQETGFVRYRLGGRYQVFRSTVALNDTVRLGSASPIVFSVLGDSKRLWSSSKRIQGPGVTEDCVVKIAGVDLLELQVTCAETGDNRAAHAVWIDPSVHAR